MFRRSTIIKVKVLFLFVVYIEEIFQTILVTDFNKIDKEKTYDKLSRI